MIESLFQALSVIAMFPGDETATYFTQHFEPEVEVVEVSRSTDHWDLELGMSERFNRFDADQVRFKVQVFADEALMATEEWTGAMLRIALPERSELTTLEDGGLVRLVVEADLPEESALAYLHFRRAGNALVPVALDEYLTARSLRFEGWLVFVGSPATQSPRPGLETVAPWDNPEVMPEDQEVALDLVTAQQSGALTTTSVPVGSVSGAHGGPSSGCQGGLAGGLGLGALVLLLVRRKRGLAGLVLFASVGAASESKATIVYGYVAFWDSRTGSNATGTRLDTCVGSNTTCAVNSANCCIRGIPAAKVTIFHKAGYIIATTQSSIYGYFQFPDASYSAGTEYMVFVTFERPGYPAAQEVRDAGSNLFSAQAGGPITGVGSTYFNVGTLRVNAAPDTSSHEGNVASIWHAMTYSFVAIELEGETHHRKNYGSSNAYDVMTLNYDAGQNGNYECPDKGWIDDGSSRLVAVHNLAGALLRSRAVGCTGIKPRFPVTPFTQGSNLAPSSETYGLGFGVHALIGLLSRFNPQTAAIANVKSGTGLNCFFDHFLQLSPFMLSHPG